MIVLKSAKEVWILDHKTRDADAGRSLTLFYDFAWWDESRADPIVKREIQNCTRTPYIQLLRDHLMRPPPVASTRSTRDTRGAWAPAPVTQTMKGSQGGGASCSPCRTIICSRRLAGDNSTPQRNVFYCESNKRLDLAGPPTGRTPRKP